MAIKLEKRWFNGWMHMKAIGDKVPFSLSHGTCASQLLQLII